MSRSHRLWTHSLPLIFLVVFWGGAFWRVLFASGIDGVVFPQGDFYNHYYNFTTYQVERWNQGEFPLWNPYNGAGDPFAANIQLNTFYPPRWITALVWGRDGWQVADHMREGALHILITSLLMYGFLRHKTRRPLPAVLGGVLWAYGGYLMSYPLQQTAVLAAATWLPLMLWGVWWTFQSAGLVWGILIGSLGIALSLLGGHPQTTLYMLYAMVGYGVYVGVKQSSSETIMYERAWHGMSLRVFRVVGPLAAMCALGAALSAMQILPSLEFMRLSGRLNEFTYEQKAQGFVLADVLQILLPGLNSAMSPLYASLGGAFLALLAIISRPAKQEESTGQPIVRETWIWCLIAIVALGIGLGAQTPLYSVANALMPGLGFFRQPERTALITQFALVMLAVEGCQIFTDSVGAEYPSGDFVAPPVRSHTPAVWTMIVIGFAVMSLVGLAINWDTSTRDTWSLIALSAVLFAAVVGYGRIRSWHTNEVSEAMRLRSSIQQRFLPLVLLMLLALDLLLHLTHTIPYVPDTSETHLSLPPIMAQTQVPDPRDIRWRVDGAFGLRDDALALRIPNIYHAGPLAIATTEDIRHMPVNRFWEVLSVRYVTLAIDQGFPTEWGLMPMGEGINSIDLPFRLYELPDPRPLAVLVYDSRDGGGDRAFARQIMADERINLRDIAVTTVPLVTPLPGIRPTLNEIWDLQFESPEILTVFASTETNALLTLSIPRYPGWQAWVNGALVETVEVYGGLIGIPLAAGENQRIDLKFFSRPVSVGILMSAGAGLMWLGIALWAIRWR